MIVVCSILYFYRRKRQSRQTQPIYDDGIVDQLKPGTMDPQVMKLDEEGKTLDPPPAYPYDKTASNPSIERIPSSNNDTPSDSTRQDQAPFYSREFSEGSDVDFYAHSTKHHQRERSHLSPDDPDIISYHDRPEIDGTPLHEVPEPSKQLTDSTAHELASSKPLTQALVNDGRPGHVDLDHLSKLEQEERQLQEDIAQIERLERLKAEREKVRQRIRELNQ